MRIMGRSDAGYWILDARYRMHDTRCRMQDEKE
jgi:hypothetical protein